MTERNLGRPWNAHEDRLLTDAVALHGPSDNWKIIALSVPGRTNKACRKVLCNPAVQCLRYLQIIPVALASFPVTFHKENSLER